MGNSKHRRKVSSIKSIATKQKIRTSRPSLQSFKLIGNQSSFTSKSKRRIFSITDSKNDLKKISRKENSQENHSTSILPFTINDRILLVGEGDLSFARSLIEYHSCSQIIATVYESEVQLRELFPHVDENIRTIKNSNQAKVWFNFDATNPKSWTRWLGSKLKKSTVTRTLNRIIFNFPHVGGKSKDVNRQVRYNQVSFFRQALPYLSPSHGSSILVTLFDGEPYTLWNVRDLARHCGLEVLRSFKFDFSMYPGYKHSRTLGVVKTKLGTLGGGWRGEERPARTFVFVRKGEGQVVGVKCGANQESSDEEVVMKVKKNENLKRINCK